MTMLKADTAHVPKEFTVLMALLISIVAISIDAFLPALGIIGADLGIEHPNHAQYMVSFIFLGMAIGQLVCGPLSDAFGRKPVLYYGMIFYLAGSVLGFVASSLPMMLVARFLQGVGVSAPYVSAVSIVRDRYSGDRMAKVMSLIMMIFIMVPALAPSIGQGILFIASWHYIFLLYIVYAMLIMLLLFFRLEETLPPAKRIPFHVGNILDGFKQVLQNPVTMGYTLCMGAVFGGFMGYLNSSQQIFQVQFGTGSMFTVYFGVLALTFGASSLVNSRFVEKYGMEYICKRAFAAVVAASVIFLAVHYIVPVALWMFLIYGAVLFFSMGLIFGNLNALAMQPMGHIAGIASAIIGSVSSVLSLTLGIVIGQFYDNTLIPMIWGFISLGGVALAIMHYVHASRVKQHLVEE